MTRVSAATAAVKSAIDELGEVLQPLPLPSRGWEADRADLHQAWTRLNGCLHDAAALIKNPHPGQGLETVWLRAVCRAVGDVEAEIQQWHYGWDDVLRRCDTDLRWLVYDLPHTGEKLISGTYTGKGNVLQLLEPDQPPLKRLRDLAVEWKARFQEAPDEPVGFVLESIQQRWKPWRRLRERYVQRSGELILQAVDSLDIDRSLLDDRNFVRCVIQSIDFPAYLPTELLKGKSGDGLLELIERIEPTKGSAPTLYDDSIADQSEAHQPAPPTDPNGGLPAYPTPDTYARDQWIYEKIQSHTYQSLSLALKERAKIEKWQIISSRNGFKKAAKRYADFHRLPERGFQQAPVTR